MNRLILLTVAILLAAVGNLQAATIGLAAQYQFDGNLTDSSGHGLDLTAGGTFSYVTDRNGNANSAVQLLTAASNGTFFLGIGPDLANQSSSVSFWIREDKPADEFVGSWVFGLGHPAGTGGAFGEDMHISLGSNIIRYSFFYNELDRPMALTPFQWYNITGTYDNTTGNRVLYLNGEVIAEGPGTPFFGATYLKMGFEGSSLDDFRFYNRALSANEVAGLAGVPDSLSTGWAIGLVFAAAGVLGRHTKLVRRQFTGLGIIKAISAALAAVALGLVSTAYGNSISLSDDFNGGSLNPSKWTTILPYSQSSVVQAGGDVTTSGRGYLATVSNYSAPYVLSGSFTMLDELEHFNIAFRTDLTFLPDPDLFSTMSGMFIEFSNDGNQISIQGRGFSPQFSTPSDHKGYALTTGQLYRFSLFDNGTDIALQINGVTELTASTTNGTGNHIAFYSREFGAGTALHDVNLSSVPDTSSTLATLCVGLGGICAFCFRRRTAMKPPHDLPSG